MAFAKNRKQQGLFTAWNLNDVYGRLDRKIFLALGGKSPLFAESWTFTFPAGIWYVFTSGSVKRLYDSGGGIPGIGSDYRLNHDQDLVESELSKLDSVALDIPGRQVYCDNWYIPGVDNPDADVESIHYSLALHTREINGVSYDVHLGLQPPDPWRTGEPARDSWVRASLDAATISPAYPPARIHNYKRAVAEIACEGLSEFTIKESWRRFDCWRVHNCGNANLIVKLPYRIRTGDGFTAGTILAIIPPFQCRAFRRTRQGGWNRYWQGLASEQEMVHFFRYETGDVPLFSGGPSSLFGSGDYKGLAHEQSQYANNLANPWIALEWMQRLCATLDPRVPYNIRGNYGEFYADPSDLTALIGDCVHTWGRARLVDGAGNSKIITIPSTDKLVESLAVEGISVFVSGTDATVTSAGPWLKIYPLDCSVFVTASDPFWSVSSSPATYSVAYPRYYCTAPQPSTTSGQQWAQKDWTASSAPTIFDTIDTLRKKVAFEFGWTAAVDEYEEIPSNIPVSEVTLTPFGLAMRVSTTAPIFDVALGFEGTTEYEDENTISILYDDQGLHPREIAKGTSLDPVFSLDNYIAGDLHVLLAPPNALLNATWRDLFPTVYAGAPGSGYPAAWTAYVPAGGPWGYSRMVYDYAIRAAFEITSDDDTFSYGADFWINKWGGPGGVDASVRIPGKPNETPQWQDANAEEDPNWEGYTIRPAGADDIWFDSNLPLKAGTTPLGTSLGTGFDGYTRILHATEDWAVQPYHEVTPFFHKIAKTAFLWDLLEYCTRAWRRIHRRVKGERDVPIAEGRMLFDAFSTTPFGEEPEGYVAYLNFQGYSDLLGLGLPVIDNGSGTYYILISDLASWISRNGGWSYNLDSVQYPPSNPGGIVVQKRAYGPQEQTEDISLYSVAYGWERSARHRFVNLVVGGDNR